MSVPAENPELIGPARAFLAKTQKILIDYQSVELASGKRFEVQDPASDETITTVPEANLVQFSLRRI